MKDGKTKRSLRHSLHKLRAILSFREGRGTARVKCDTSLGHPSLSQGSSIKRVNFKGITDTDRTCEGQELTLCVLNGGYLQTFLTQSPKDQYMFIEDLTWYLITLYFLSVTLLIYGYEEVNKIWKKLYDIELFWILMWLFCMTNTLFAVKV